MKKRSTSVSVRALCEALELRCLLNAPGANYTLAFDDEFNGTSMSGDTNWSNYLPWTSNQYEGGSYVDYMINTNQTIGGVAYTSNVSESGGQLHLNTQAISTPIVVNGTTFNYTGAMMTTSSSFQTAYGYAEIRAQLPTGQGNWPAFWSLGNGWPPENDIMEDWPTGPRFHQGLYGMDATWHDYDDTTSSTVPSTTFHVYAMQWGPGFENFYVDGNLAYSTVAAGVPAADIPTESMYFLLNSAVASGQTGSFSNSSDNELNVDWVRIYTYTPTGGPGVANPTFNTASNYTLSGTAAYNVGTNLGYTSNGDLHIYGGAGEADQTITGLTPNTTYIFGAYGEIGTGTSQGVIGVKNFNTNGTVVTSPIGSTISVTWLQASVAFTTGPTSTSATIYLSNPGTGNLNFDDLSLNVAPQAEVATTAVVAGGTVNIPVESGFGTFTTITVSSSNTSVVANSGITLNSKDTSLAVTALSGATGSTTISLTATTDDTNSSGYGDLFVGSVVSTFVLSVLPEATISGTTGQANTFRLVRDGANVDVYVNNTTNTPTMQEAYSADSAIALTGQNSGNTLTVDYSGGDPVPAGGIIFTGGSGTDSLNFVGLSGANAITLSSGSSVQINSDFIYYTNVDNMNLDLGSGTNTLSSVSPTTLPTVTLEEDAGGTTTIGGASGTLPSHTIVSIASGGTFSIAGAAESIDQVNGAGALILGQLTVGGANGTSTFSGIISGPIGGLTKIGTGTLLLTGNNTFTGTIAIGTGANPAGNGDGILRITTGNAVDDASSLTLTDNNGSYDLFQIDGTNAPVTVSLPITLNANNFSGPYGVPVTLIESVAGNNTVSSPITFTTGGNGYGIQADAGSLAFTDPLTLTHILYMRGAGNGSFTNVLSGAGALTFQGSGNWALSGANTYSGTTTVSSGQLTLSNNAALGATSSLTVTSGATLALQGTITIPSGLTYTINGSGVGGAGALLNVSGNNVWSSSLTMNSAGATIGATLGKLTLNSALSGGPLTKVGAGTLVLPVANDYTGGTSINGGILNFSSLGGLGTGTTLNFGGGTLQYAAGNTADISGLTVTLNSSGGTIDTNGNSLVTFAYAIGNKSAGGLTKVGVGTLALNGASYTGATSIAGGTLQLTNGSLSSTSVSTSTGAILTINSGATISASSNLTDAGTANFNNANPTIATLHGSGTINLSPGSALTVTAGGNFTGVINDPAATVTISGGALVFSGVNTYAGDTDIIGGSLEIASPGSLASGNINISSGAALTVDSGAAISSSTNLTDAGTANFNNASQTIATLNGAGTLNLNGTALTITNGGTFSGPVTGNSSLIVGGGLLTLTSTGSVAIPAITVNASATANINGALTATSAIIVNGNLNFGSADANNDPTAGILVWNLGPLTVGSSGDVVVDIATSSATYGVITTSSLNNTAGGTLDLTNNDMIVFGGNPAAVSSEITSSSAAANPTLMTLAIVQNAGEFSTFDTQPVNIGDVLVKYTLFGDALLTGSITAADYVQIDNGYNSQGGPDPLTGWYNGDFNGDNQINGDDYTLIDNAYNSQGSVSIAASPASQIATNAAQIAGTSHASIVAASGAAEMRPFAAAVVNPIAGDNTDAQELKKRRSSAWEILEGDSP